MDERVSIHSEPGSRVLEVPVIQKMDAEERLEEYFGTVDGRQ